MGWGVGGGVSQQGFVKGVGRWELKQKQPCKGGAEQQPDKHGPADLLRGARLKLTEARERSRGCSWSLNFRTSGWNKTGSIRTSHGFFSWTDVVGVR